MMPFEGEARFTSAMIAGACAAVMRSANRSGWCAVVAAAYLGLFYGEDGIKD